MTLGYAVHSSFTVGAFIREQEFGGGIGHAKITRGIPSSGSKKDYGDDGTAHDKRRMGVAPSG